MLCCTAGTLVTLREAETPRLAEPANHVAYGERPYCRARRDPARAPQLQLSEMTWAEGEPALLQGWMLVLGGVVQQTLIRRRGHDTPYSRMKVERVLVDAGAVECRREPCPTYCGESQLLVQGLADPRVGDRFIVFVREYDGGFAVQRSYSADNPQQGVGYRVSSWGESIVEAVKTYAESATPRLLFRDPSYADIWRAYDSTAVDCRINAYYGDVCGRKQLEALQRLPCPPEDSATESR